MSQERERSPAENVFMQILPVYMDFLERRDYFYKNNKGQRINLYDCFFLDLVWKRPYRKYLLSTTLHNAENYTPTDEDKKILKEISDLVKNDTIEKIVNWYHITERQLQQTS
jgi:hypothetical protein